MDAVPHDRVFIGSDQKIKIETDKPVERLELHSSFSKDQYNHFVYKKLNKYISTDHVLIVQPDGFGSNKEFWDSDYLNYDFISSPSSIYNPKVRNTIAAFYPPGTDPNTYLNFCKTVFNGAGGFTLRSKKLLQALSNDDCVFSINNVICEDFNVSVVHRELLIKKYGIEFADIDTTMKFCQEDIYNFGLTLGFHGWFNIPFYLQEQELINILHHIDLTHQKYNIPLMRANLAQCNYWNCLNYFDYLNQRKYGNA